MKSYEHLILQSLIDTNFPDDVPIAVHDYLDTVLIIQCTLERCLFSHCMPIRSLLLYER